MRNLFFTLFFFLGYISNAQQILNAETSSQFIAKTVESLNLKLWKAASAQKVTVYRNDSLSSVLTSDNIQKWFKTYKRREIMDPEEGVFNRFGSVVFEPHPFEILTEQKGLQFLYAPAWDMSTSNISLELIAIAPRWSPLTESGIQLAEGPMFWIKLEDLNKVLTNEEVSKVKALAFVRSTLGDFTADYFTEYSESYDYGTYMAYNSVAGQKWYQSIDASMDTTLGHYLNSIVAIAAEQFYNDEGIFYKNSELTDAYRDIIQELYTSSKFGDTELKESWEFGNLGDVTVNKVGEDYILSFSTTASEPQVVFFSYAKIKPFLKEHDRIVLEALLKEIAK